MENPIKNDDLEVPLFRKHPKWSFLVGKPMVVGYPYFGVPPLSRDWLCHENFSSKVRKVGIQESSGVKVEAGKLETL